MIYGRYFYMEYRHLVDCCSKEQRFQAEHLLIPWQ